MTNRKRIGRPPEGAGTGDEPAKIREYPRMAFTVKPITKRRLKALAVLQQRPLWRIVDESISLYLSRLDPPDKKVIDGLVRRSK